MVITKITIKNFRNLANVELTPSVGITEIVHDNGWGKSNIADAIIWLFTGRLLDTSSDIESIKPKNNMKALVEVEIVLDNKTTLRKTYQENWVKTRGTAEIELRGHVTTCYLNGLELTNTVFDSKLEELTGIPKSYYPILIDPTYFGLKLDWKNRRDIVNKVVGEITFGDITKAESTFDKNPALTQRLWTALNLFNGKIDMTKKSLLQKLTLAKKEEKDLESQTAGLQTITTEIDDAAYQELLNKDEASRRSIAALDNKGDQQKKSIPQVEAEIERLRENYKTTYASAKYTGVPPTQSTCPHCGYVLNQADYDKQLAKFQKAKVDYEKWQQEELDRINKKGVALKADLATLKAATSETTDTYSAKRLVFDTEIASHQPAIESYLGFQRAKQSIARLAGQLELTRKEISANESLIDLLNIYVSTMLRKLNERIEIVFGDIRFRLIEENIKEGSWNEVCDVMDGQVPYGRTNTAQQIKLGIRVLDAIRKKLGYQALPIIVDNAEVIVDRKFDTTSQIICLIAGKD